MQQIANKVRPVRDHSPLGEAWNRLEAVLAGRLDKRHVADYLLKPFDDRDIRATAAKMVVDMSSFFNNKFNWIKADLWRRLKFNALEFFFFLSFSLSLYNCLFLLFFNLFLIFFLSRSFFCLSISFLSIFIFPYFPMFLIKVDLSILSNL